MFWNSQSGWEKQHILDAFRFELGKVDAMAVRQRTVNELNKVDHALAVAVAQGVGVGEPPEQGAGSYKLASPAVSPSARVYRRYPWIGSTMRPLPR